MKDKVLMKLPLSSDLKPQTVNLLLNQFIHDLRSLSKKKNLIIIVQESKQD